MTGPTDAKTAGAAVERFLRGLGDLDDPAIFLATAEADRLRQLAAEIDARPEGELPLRGSVFAVKDNIDVAGLPTTAGCPAFAYHPERDAVAVARLAAAGAIPVAKTNLDQFATGLVGTRSPAGPPRNPLDPDLVPGGSSSGSAVAVARGLVDFALGTDTAGSGRVPAAFGGIVGLKPTLGRIPTTGVVPAVRSADCVSVFAPSAETALAVAQLASGPDPGDAYSRPPDSASGLGPGSRIGVFDDQALAAAGASPTVIANYRNLVDQLAARVSTLIVPVDPSPLFATGDLLYGGPLVAERTAAVGDFIAAHPGQADPTVATIIAGGRGYSAVEAHQASYELAGHRWRARQVLADVDVLVTPTVPRAVSLAEVMADPLGPNIDLGRFTTFANLLDLAAVTFPTDRLLTGTEPGPEASATLYGPAWSEADLVSLVAGLLADEPAGPEHIDRPAGDVGPADDTIRLVVAGAHLRGQPLEGQLLDLGATWVETTMTAPTYRMYALPGGPPHKPALVHDPTGRAIEVDVWRIDPAGLGRFLTMIPAPLALGTVALADGSTETGFVAERRATDGATDITDTGGWRNHVAGPGPG